MEYSTIYNEKDIVIGKGLVEAVKLEEEANYPIIISGEKAQKEFLRILKEEKEEVLKQYKNFIHTIIRIDDKMYINYLLLYYKEKKFLKIREKYLYLLNYHNKIVDFLMKNSKDKKITYLIDFEEIL
ncbi:hypothetical protein KST83_02585 [Fusobacterium nucleatum]|uniref:hypothetical protein n=1 Tax=Fusobacterium nucleatum subsp. polymorphum TaxID=76857 RepID=UPI00117BA4D8|nr:hypothetical protein [Fusobacterium polymorphum]